MTSQDWSDVAGIYGAGIEAGHATFESAVPSWEAFDASRLLGHRFVAVRHGGVVGWVACTPVSARPAYAGVVEHSVYVTPDAHGQGVGSTLLATFISSTESAGIWTIQSSIFGDNRASRALHERHGFRTIGIREGVAKATVGPAAGTWRDTVLIERRSLVVGVG